MADSANIVSNVVSGASISSNLTSGSTITTSVNESTTTTSNVVTGGVGATGAAGADGTSPTAAVTGPASSTDTAIARFDSTTGTILKNSSTTIADNGYIYSPGSLETAGAIIADTIAEHTAAAGVTIDGVLLKDNTITASNIPTAWTTWVPTFTGFSADPAGGIYNYRTVGNEIEIEVVMPNNGTSNATDFTMTLPVTAATIANMEWVGYANCANNGAIVNTPCPSVIASAGTIITFWIAPNRSTLWGAANGKRCAYLRMSYRWQ